MRGIIVNNEYSGNKESLTIHSGCIDPLKLRQYLLYWDKIDYPSNNIIYNELTPDEKYLKDIGILKRTHTNFNINRDIIINPEILINSQIVALKENSKTPGEIWSIAQPTKEIILPSDECKNTRNIQVELYNCIPVPTANVSIDDILNFKERRYDELQEFRELLDEMYDSIINSCDMDFTKNRSIEKLQNKVIDINKIMNESKIKRFLSNVKVELNINELITAGLKVFVGYEIGQRIGFPSVGSTIGLASATINLSSEFSLKPNFIPDELKDYAYLFYANKELI